jgi:hypothetical protein
VSKILITGGKGLVGTEIVRQLKDQGKHEVSILSRNPKPNAEPKEYYWDVERGEIDSDALKTDHIIHLAGAGVADKRWSAERKKEILDSRVDSTTLLFESVKEEQIPLQSFISASAIGYYGSGPMYLVFTENSDPGDDFLAEVVTQWEQAISQFKEMGIRTAAIRIGIVLSAEGGALEKMVQPVKLGVGAPLGSGSQVMSWIHISDLAGLFVWAIDNESVSGPINAVSPHPVTNKEMTRMIARVLNKPMLLPAVPGFVLKMALGEMAEIVLEGSHVSGEKLLSMGYKLQYPELQEALESLLKN